MSLSMLTVCLTLSGFSSSFASPSNCYSGVCLRQVEANETCVTVTWMSKFEIAIDCPTTSGRRETPRRIVCCGLEAATVYNLSVTMRMHQQQQEQPIRHSLAVRTAIPAKNSASVISVSNDCVTFVHEAKVGRKNQLRRNCQRLALENEAAAAVTGLIKCCGIHRKVDSWRFGRTINSPGTRFTAPMRPFKPTNVRWLESSSSCAGIAWSSLRLSPDLTFVVTCPAGSQLSALTEKSAVCCSLLPGIYYTVSVAAANPQFGVGEPASVTVNAAAGATNTNWEDATFIGFLCLAAFACTFASLSAKTTTRCMTRLSIYKEEAKDAEAVKDTSTITEDENEEEDEEAGSV